MIKNLVVWCVVLSVELLITPLYADIVVIGNGAITGTTAAIDFTNFDVSSSGLMTPIGGINLSGGTTSDGNTIDFGSGSDDDLTATDVTDLTDAGATTLHSHAALIIKDNEMLDDAYNNDSSGDAQITVDARDISIDLNDSSNDYKFSIDNTTTGAITTAMEIVTSGGGATFTNGIDISDGGITNALLVGATNISGTTATITFTDFQVAADGNMTLAPDNAADALTLNLAAAAIQGIKIAAANQSTNANGIIDINFSTSTSNAVAVDVSMTVLNGAGSAVDFFGLDLFVRQDDTDSDMIGMNMVFANSATAGAGSYKAAIALDNQDTTSGVVSSAIDLAGVGGTDGLDVSDPNITNAINVGGNILAALGMIPFDFTDFDVDGDGFITIASDTAGSTPMIDLNLTATSGTQDIALRIGTDGAVITDAIDVTDAEIVNGINIGANTILGTGGVVMDCQNLTGTCTINFKNSSGDSLIVDMRTNTVELTIPTSTPANNGNGLYYDTTNNKLCVDDADGTDRCTGTMALSAFTPNESEEILLKNNRELFSQLVPLSITQIHSLKSMGELAETSQEKMIDDLLGISISDYGQVSTVYQKGNVEDIFTVDEVKKEKKVFPLSYGARPYLSKRGMANLHKGSAKIILAQKGPYFIELTPLGSRIEGNLWVSEQGEDYFVVTEKNGQSDSPFLWKVMAESQP